jgi:hypothetical protein
MGWWFGKDCKHQICQFEKDCNGVEDTSQPDLVFCNHKENHDECEGNCTERKCPLLNGLYVKDISLNKGGLDLSLTGEIAKAFMQNLVQMFKDNGGKNFLTLTVMDKENKYAITIQNCNGTDTPAEKLQRLSEEIAALKARK